MLWLYMKSIGLKMVIVDAWSLNLLKRSQTAPANQLLQKL